MVAWMISWCYVADKQRGDSQQYAVARLPSPTQSLLPSLWRDGLFWLTLALTVFAIAPFMLPGYFWGANDARHQVYFLFEFDRVVQDGIWWPRWSPDFAFGYGYPFFNIYGPLSHFLAELLLHFFGFSYTGAIETIFGLSIVGSAAAMYVYVRSWLGRSAAIIAALVYVYAPYHLLNLYVRGHLAESMAFVWLPLCLWTVRQAVVRPAYRWVVGAALSYAGLMLTSNLVIVLFTPLLGIYLLVLVWIYAKPATITQARQPVWRQGWIFVQRAFVPGIGLLSGLGLSAIFWIPALLEYKDVRVDQWFDVRYDFRGHFVYFFQLFSPDWGFGASIPGPNDPISFQIGVAPLVFMLFGLILAWKTLGELRPEVICLLVFGLLAVLVGVHWAAPLWDVPLLSSILRSAQFPWRWLSLTTLCFSILAGLLAYRQARFTDQLTLPLLTVIAIILLAGYPYLQVQIIEPLEGPVSLAGLMRFQQSSDEMTGSTRWVKEIPTWSPIAEYYINQERAGQPVQPIDTKIDYGNTTYPQDENFAVRSVAHNTVMEEVYFLNKRDTEQRIVFNQFYYPGWTAYLLDGQHGQPVQPLEVIPEETGTLGRMTVPVPTGEGYVLLRFEATPLRRAAQIISLGTLVLLLVGTLWTQRARFLPHRSSISAA